MNPVMIDENGIPYFTNHQIKDYGMPEYFGYEKYLIIESREKTFVTDYNMEQEGYFTKVHRYDRIGRFKATLLNLIGHRGKIPEHVISIVEAFLDPQSKDVWNATRAILKHYKLRRYYDNIPIILQQLKICTGFKKLEYTQVEAIINDFKCLSDRFERTKKQYKRRYFPNIRYVALKLLELHGIHPMYKIPLARTARKNKSLDDLWVSLVSVNQYI
jgi:hypothetical protein